MEEIVLHVNGGEHRIDADPSTPLLFVLRNHLGLTGAKLGCGLEQCGACAVLVDGRSTLTCSAPVGDFAGREIVTAEGLAVDAVGAAVQNAFIDAGAAQCGYCTPGLVIAATALLTRNASPSAADVRDALSPHLCRCGSHARVLAAVAGLSTGAAE
ncbi:MAG: (2Fe-2S)-binding protein [Magnetovibrio sp.]|nr:(2Fe-2S)-binding protein [Magnetovibrio sp.]